MRLDGTWLAQRIVELVEPAVVIEPLPVEQAAQQHHRLIEPIQTLPETGPEIDAERIVLALEPGAADAQDGATARDVVQRRGELGGVTRVAERVGPDHQPEADTLGDRTETREDHPALERGLFPRPEDREQVVPGPDRIPAHVVGRDGRVAKPGPVGLLGPDLEPEPHRHQSL